MKKENEKEMMTQNESIPAEHAENEAAEDATPEVQKATAILRAKLPALGAANLNFEKRTGNFFRATLVKQEDGTEKLVRGVVEDSEIPADCAAEIAAKRAAAFVQAEEKNREKIAAEDKARRDQEQSIANAQADAAHAQSIIEQATEVHDHPEITESLAGSLARDKAEHAETEREVAQLEATEDAVRERTRDSRIKFTGAIVCIIAAILVIIAIWLFASK